MCAHGAFVKPLEGAQSVWRTPKVAIFWENSKQRTIDQNATTLQPTSVSLHPKTNTNTNIHLYIQKSCWLISLQQKQHAQNIYMESR